MSTFKKGFKSGLYIGAQGTVFLILILWAIHSFADTNESRKNTCGNICLSSYGRCLQNSVDYNKVHKITLINEQKICKNKLNFCFKKFKCLEK